MTELLWFVGGLLFGGFVSTMFLCCLQLHRINKYEALIRETKLDLLNNQAIAKTIVYPLKCEYSICSI